jgi:hypothetical protein
MIWWWQWWYWDMNVKGGLSWGNQQDGVKKILSGEKDWSTLYEDTNETHQMLFGGRRMGGGNGNIMEGEHLFKVHNTHVQNHQNETPSYY